LDIIERFDVIFKL